MAQGPGFPADLRDRPAALSIGVERNAFALRSIQRADIEGAVTLVDLAMNPDEGRYARKTLEYHFRVRSLGIDDGRTLFVLTKDGVIQGIVGLHALEWGPPENVWLSWFAVLPRLQGQGLGSAMLEAVTHEARLRNYVNFYIETYSTPDFARARAFYRVRGFREVGGIPSYLPNGGDMVVFYKSLIPTQ